MGAVSVSNLTGSCISGFGRRSRDGAQTGWIDDPDATSASLDEAALLEILQNHIDGFPGDANEIAEVSLIQPDGDEHALLVWHAEI